MSIQVETKDCTALTDNELSDMADMGAGSPGGIDIGLLSKAKEDWVLCTTAHLDDKPQGIMFSTLERIGGTPCVLLGLVSVKHTSRRESIMRGLMNEAYHRALMAFPDEDVLVGSARQSVGLRHVQGADRHGPRPGRRAVGEERAWGRRLAKRFHVESSYDEQTFQVKANASGVFDYESLKPETVDPEVVALFKGMKPAKGDVLIAFGWAMAEDLLKLGSR